MSGVKRPVIARSVFSSPAFSQERIDLRSGSLDTFGVLVQDHQPHKERPPDGRRRTVTHPLRRGVECNHHKKRPLDGERRVVSPPRFMEARSLSEARVPRGRGWHVTWPFALVGAGMMLSAWL